jgi:hypothetical protein
MKDKFQKCLLFGFVLELQEDSFDHQTWGRRAGV